MQFTFYTADPAYVGPRSIDLFLMQGTLIVRTSTFLLTIVDASCSSLSGTAPLTLATYFYTLEPLAWQLTLVMNPNPCTVTHSCSSTLANFCPTAGVASGTWDEALL